MTIREYGNAIKNIIEATMDNVNVEIKEVIKNNGIAKTGIIIRESDSNIAPTIYINEMYDQDMSVKQAAAEVIDIYNNNNTPSIDVSFFMDYMKVKTKLRAKLLNANNNQYAGISAKEYGYDDLKIVPYVTVEFAGNNGSITVTSEHLANWNKTADEVVQDAMQNMQDDFSIKTMGEFIGNMMGEPVENNVLNDIYIITTKDNINGAIAAILAKDRIAELLGSEYVVLPSSIHEVIALRNDDNVEALTNMVRCVNATTVLPEEQLSDRAYLLTA